MSITREFHGFKVSDDFVLTLNARGGTKQINLQEMMAIRLSKSIDGKKYPWSSSSPDITDTVAQDLDMSYNHETNCRSTNQWINARQHFSKNNALSKEQENLLDGFKSRNGSKSESGITFNTTHAKSLGNAIFSELEKQKLDQFVSAYDSGNSEYLFAEHVRQGVMSFANAVFATQLHITHAEREKARLAEKAKREKQLEELKVTAEKSLADMGITKDNELYDTMLISQMALIKSVIEKVS